jgi:hypothetical protein
MTHTLSCGCLKRRRSTESPNWKGCGKIPGTHWSDIRISARRRSIVFDVSIDYCWSLYVKQQGRCALSGAKLSFGSRKWKDDITASLDRRDSDKPYMPGNVQWVHKNVNIMKGALDEERFVELCVLVTHPIRARTASSGCFAEKRGNRFTGCGNLSRLHWLRIVRGATSRSLPLEVTIEETWEKFVAQRGRCALTGLELDWDVICQDSTRRHRGCASLDRKNSDNGYTADNVQWVHKDVNMMKLDLNEVEFRRWCRLVAKHRRSQCPKSSKD